MLVAQCAAVGKKRLRRSVDRWCVAQDVREELFTVLGNTHVDRAGEDCVAAGGGRSGRSDRARNGDLGAIVGDQHDCDHVEAGIVCEQVGVSRPGERRCRREGQTARLQETDDCLERLVETCFFSGPSSSGCQEGVVETDESARVERRIGEPGLCATVVGGDAVQRAHVSSTLLFLALAIPRTEVGCERGNEEQQQHHKGGQDKNRTTFRI